MSTVAAFFKDTCATLASVLGSKAEGEAAARIIFEDVAGYDRKFLFINGDRTLTDFMTDRINDAVDRVRRGEPVQYAVGKAQFMGNDFEVNTSVLIPRPETAGLVDMIVNDFNGRTDLDIADLGTGSGCIAISLARALPFSHVTGIDNSAEALKVARDNSEALHQPVEWLQADILKLQAPSAPLFDIIVSNPPYVCLSERAEMDPRVLNYEPTAALFVPDDNPLLFYRAIARYAKGALRPGGRLYFEINQKFPREMRSLLEDAGFEDVDVIRDYKGNYRYATATQPSAS